MEGKKGGEREGPRVRLTVDKRNFEQPFQWCLFQDNLDQYHYIQQTKKNLTFSALN